MSPPLVVFEEFQKHWCYVFFKCVGQITRESIGFWTFHCWEVLITTSVYVLTIGLLRVSISPGVTFGSLCASQNYLLHLSEPIFWYSMVPFWSLLWIWLISRRENCCFHWFSCVFFSSIDLCSNIHNYFALLTLGLLWSSPSTEPEERSNRSRCQPARGPLSKSGLLGREAITGSSGSGYLGNFCLNWHSRPPPDCHSSLTSPTARHDAQQQTELASHEPPQH